MLVSFGGEGSNLFGEPLLENVREAWNDWRKANEVAARYDRKIAGAYLVLHYPSFGQGIDQNGAKLDNVYLAQRILDKLEGASGVAIGDVPSELRRVRTPTRPPGVWRSKAAPAASSEVLSIASATWTVSRSAACCCRSGRFSKASTARWPNRSRRATWPCDLNSFFCLVDHFDPYHGSLDFLRPSHEVGRQDERPFLVRRAIAAHLDQSEPELELWRLLDVRHHLLCATADTRSSEVTSCQEVSNPGSGRSVLICLA